MYMNSVLFVPKELPTGLAAQEKMSKTIMPLCQAARTAKRKHSLYNRCTFSTSQKHGAQDHLQNKKRRLHDLERGRLCLLLLSCSNAELPSRQGSRTRVKKTRSS